MSTNIMSSLDTLPVELLHRIFDSLDTETIINSLQYVCKRLNSVTNNYNRYKLNFQSILKYKFHQLCRHTDPKNVISLILSNENQTPGQIGLFLSLYHIEEYTRLQTINLISIEESYLKIILESLSINSSLTSLIIHHELYSYINRDITQLISLIIKKNNLRKLDLNLGYSTIEQLQWPDQSSIQYLKLSDRISLQMFCTILRCSPYLNTMILQDCLIDSIDEFNSLIPNTTVYKQLTSLILEDCDLNVILIELLLSLTPSLVHFTIQSNDNDFYDGARWEQFIQTKLLNLIQFQFAFQFNMTNDSTALEALIASFQTPFWLEIKQWFVTALRIQNSSVINLYTTEDCAKKITYRPKANKISCSTIPTTMKDLITMDSVHELSLNLAEMQADITEQIETSTHRLFNKLTKLIIRLNLDWPENSLKLLSSLIDLSTIIDLELDISFALDDISNITDGIVGLLEQTTNIRSLIIASTTVSLETICTIMSDRVRYLQIYVNSVEDIKIILKLFDHLSSVTFKFLTDSLVRIAEIIEWLLENGKDFTYQSTKFSLSLWLGKNIKG